MIRTIGSKKALLPVDVGNGTDIMLPNERLTEIITGLVAGTHRLIVTALTAD